MLPAGIIIMVASIVVGVIALTSAALMSSRARSAGRRTRTAMGLSGEEEEGARAYIPEAEYVSRWVLLLAILSGVGLVLGMLMVMIASIP